MVGGIFQRLRRPIRFIRDKRGVSAVEFALILPVMLTMYLGCNELGNGLTIARKVTHVTSTLSDLVTQSKNSISSTEMTNILNAAASIMTPYGTSLLKIKVSEYKIDANSKVTVEWSSAYNDTALTKNAVITNLPANVKQASTYLITAEVHYAYTPTIGYVMTGTFDLHDQFYLRPRLSDGITGPS
ncbi:MAG TPA: TadE/TadG family type IV pilus assembly protein [Bauldia sp.]|nr:TadE/TadG family type IV pilus assembly protein [Bauldia sp.]